MPIIATGPKGSYDDIWYDIYHHITSCCYLLIFNSNPGELTDRGRETTLALGRRLRHLYVEQLGFVRNSSDLLQAPLTHTDALVDCNQ